MENQSRDDWKFHIHWNKLEWVNIQEVVLK